MNERVINMKKIISTLLVVCFMMISLTALAGDITVLLDGKQLRFDQNPIIENDRTLVPVRKIFEELGADVQWREKDAVVTAKKDDMSIRLQINSNWMLQNGELIYLDAAPKIVGDRTLVPLRAISESFGAAVTWEASSQTVYVTTAGNVPNAPDSETPITPDTPENTPGDTPSSEENDFEQQVLDLVNQERQKAGLAPLSWNSDLANVARAHSKDMSVRNFMSHTNPDGLSPFDRIKNAGISYRSAAENIAAGQATPQSVMQGWMNSAGHKANILNPDLKEIGVGYFNSTTGYKHYWTQVFIAQ